MLGAGRDRRQAALPLGASRREEATSWDPHPSVCDEAGHFYHGVPSGGSLGCLPWQLALLKPNRSLRIHWDS